MSIAKLKKVQIVVPRKSVQALVDSFEEMEILHIDDIHEKISKEFTNFITEDFLLLLIIIENRPLAPV